MNVLGSQLLRSDSIRERETILYKLILFLLHRKNWVETESSTNLKFFNEYHLFWCPFPGRCDLKFSFPISAILYRECLHRKVTIGKNSLLIKNGNLISEMQTFLQRI